MAISDKTRKVLWAKSGNRCALCKCELVMDCHESNSRTIIGDECHVVAQSNGGPRAGQISADRLDEYNNLILLCRNDHRVVDEQVSKYHSDELLRIKLEHENWVNLQLSGKSKPLSELDKLVHILNTSSYEWSKNHSITIDLITLRKVLAHYDELQLDEQAECLVAAAAVYFGEGLKLISDRYNSNQSVIESLVRVVGNLQQTRPAWRASLLLELCDNSLLSTSVNRLLSVSIIPKEREKLLTLIIPAQNTAGYLHNIVQTTPAGDDLYNKAKEVIAQFSFQIRDIKSSSIQDSVTVIPPSVNSSIPPDFHRMDADRFEEMSCALYQEEPEILRAELYRIKYQSQYGIDVSATRADGSGLEVASCKCYTSIKKGEIPKWSLDFLTHWESHWKTKNVKKFVLIVACNVNSEEREAEIDFEVDRFDKLGIGYEVWGPRQLQRKIRRHPGLVMQYLGDWWVSHLCGTSQSASLPPPPSNDSGILSAEIIAQFSSLQKELSGSINQLLDVTQEEINQSNIASAETKLTEIRTGHGWHQLLPEVKARVIRLQASLYLQRGDIDCAERLENEADAICLQKEPRLRALILYRRFGAEKGLQLLGSSSERDSLHLQISLLLETGQVDETFRIFDNNPMLTEDHAETVRLKAFALLLQGDRKKAYDTILLAEKLKPTWSSVQRAGAMIRYALALSPVLTSEWFLYPNPIDLDLVRDDNQGRILLAEALKRFEYLAEHELDSSRKQLDDAWILACLCNLRNRLDDAELRCKLLLSEDPLHTGAVDWALARGFDFDRDASKYALNSFLEQGDGSFEHAISLTWLHLADGHIQNAIDVLNRYVDRFNTSKLRISYDAWVAELEKRQLGVSSSHLEDSVASFSYASTLIEQATASNEWTPVERLFERMVSTRPLPAITLKTAQSLAFAGRWEMLGKYLDVILQFGTSEAVRIAAYAAFNAKKPDTALKILDENTSAFADGKIPHELRTLQINALALLGNQSTALRYAETLAAETSEIRHRLLKASLLINTGNIAGSLAIIREAAQSKKLSPQEALRLSHVVALEDKDLARTLWQQSVGNIPNNFSVLAMDIASRIGLAIDSTPVIQQIGELIKENSPFIRTIAVSELDEFMSRLFENAKQLQSTYFKGAIPVHLYCEQSNENLAKMFCLDSSEAYRMQQPLLIRHGGRPSNNRLVLPIEDWCIHLDITGLFIAAQLELLDFLEQLSHPIVISPSLPAALIELESNLQRTSISDEQQIQNVDGVHVETHNSIKWLTPLRNRVAQGIENGRYKPLPAALSHDIDDTDEASNRLLSPLMKCIFDLLNAPQVDGAVLWTDDRNLSGYQNSQGNPIIGIFEVLNALSASKLISEIDRYQALHKLRAANANLIPFKPNELLHVLSQSPVEEGRIVETPALAAIRKNFASVLLSEDHLKLDESEESLKGKPSEIDFLVEQQRLVTQCIIAQWKQPGIDDDSRSARASWIWSALRIDRFNRLPKGITVFSSRFSVLALHIFSLLAGISQLPSRDAESVQHRINSYMEWIGKEVIDFRIEKDNDLLQAVVNYLASLLLQVVKEAEKFGTKGLEDCKSLIRIQIQQYPKLIREKLECDNSFCKKMGIKIERVVTIEGVSFKSDQFWGGIATTLLKGRGQASTIRDKKQHVIFKKAGNDKNTVSFSGVVKGRFSDAALGLLDNVPGSRRKILLANPHWFDLPIDERKPLIEKIVTAPLLTDRICLLEDARDASVSFQYLNLESQLRNQEKLPFNVFSPLPATALLKHLRWPQDYSGTFSERVQKASTELIKEHGWQFAFFRFAALPVNLSPSIIDAFLSMEGIARHAAIQMLQGQAATPLQMIQLLHLLKHLPMQNDSLFQEYLNKVLENWQPVAKAFITILRWSEASFASDAHWRNLPPEDRLVLVWTHADRLTEIFVKQQVVLDQVISRFEDNHPAKPLEHLLLVNTVYESAPANPRTIDAAVILYFGLNYALHGKRADEILQRAQIEQITDKLIIEGDGKRILSPWLFIFRGSAPDSMDSFFTSHPTGLFDETKGLSLDHIINLLEKAFEDLEETPNSPLHWAAIKLFARADVDELRRNRISSALGKLNLVEMVSQHEDDTLLLQIIGTCAVQFGGNESRNHILDQLSQVAKYYARKYPGRVPRLASAGESKSLNALKQLVEGAAALSQSDDLSESLGQFGEILVSLANAWSGAAPVLSEVADNTIRQVCLKSSGNLWKPVLTLRAMQ